MPLRSFPPDLLDAATEALAREYPIQITVRDPVPLPNAAYYPPRKRYRANALLDYLDTIAAETGDPRVRVLGLTEVDISVPDPPKHEDWGIFGLGTMGGPSAVVSSFRLKRRPKSREQVRFRVATVAVHELGHTFGLGHCAEQAVECVMIDAEGGIENTDTSSGTFGPGCKAALEATLVANGSLGLFGPE